MEPQPISSQEQEREVQIREYYRVDVDSCTFGTVSSKGEYREKSNFSIELETYVDGDNAGYFAWVKRKSDGRRQLCFYTTESLIVKQNFLKEIRSTFGAGGFVCSLTEKELSEFHQHMERNFPFQDQDRVKNGLLCAGKQPGTNVWVLNKHLHINENGKQIAESESKYAWQPIGGPSIELAGKSMSHTSIDLQCNIRLPLQSTGPLCNLLKLMQVVFKHNFIPSVLSVAAVIMALHYELLVKTYDACPIPLLVGESETGLSKSQHTLVTMSTFHFSWIPQYHSPIGKSSAVSCALALCGQEDGGHLMKTKSTSDTVCIERCCKSTLPFSLDDPKTAEGIGELLIDLCNGRLMGNMKVGLRKPRSIPLICCNFTMGNLQRYSSRALLIPFSGPSIGPTTEEESKAFAQLAVVQREASSAIGWAVSLGKEFMGGGETEVSSRISPAVRSRLPGVDPRLCTGYALLLYFVEKIVEKAQMPDMKEEFEEFLDEVYPHLLKSTLAPRGSQDSSIHLSIVAQVLTEVADWAQSHSEAGDLYKVLQTIRTGVSYQGKKAVAVCLEDLTASLSFSATDVRKAVKGGNLGKHNVSKDFVPLNSTNPTIRREINSKSRKCTVIWLEKLPSLLQEKLHQATQPSTQAYTSSSTSATQGSTFSSTSTTQASTSSSPSTTQASTSSSPSTTQASTSSSPSTTLASTSSSPSTTLASKSSSASTTQASTSSSTSAMQAATSSSASTVQATTSSTISTTQASTSTTSVTQTFTSSTTSSTQASTSSPTSTCTVQTFSVPFNQDNAAYCVAANDLRSTSVSTPREFGEMPKKPERKRSALQDDAPPPKHSNMIRSTRRNTQLPEWSKDINPKDPLGLDY